MTRPAGAPVLAALMLTVFLPLRAAAHAQDGTPERFWDGTAQPGAAGGGNRDAPALPAGASGAVAGVLSNFGSVQDQGEIVLSDEDRLDLICLRESYPGSVGDLYADSGGNLILRVNGQDVVFRRGMSARDAVPPDCDISESMRQPYEPEPQRPETPAGYAPGRRRSARFMMALYGHSPQQVGKKLQVARFLGQQVRVSPGPALALEGVSRMLDGAIRADPAMRRLLRVDGGYMWRRIAGENALSPHSFGMAVDLSSDRAPYWRWSRVFPHPMQKTYPSEIVGAFESRGFIWGGKWHEYDLMHFEYRPELLCKARLRALPR